MLDSLLQALGFLGAAGNKVLESREIQTDTDEPHLGDDRDRSFSKDAVGLSSSCVSFAARISEVAAIGGVTSRVRELFEC